MPECSAAVTAPFDSIINVIDLPIDNIGSWIFKHRLVELCTAVKGTAFQYIAAHHDAGRIYYFDPDILVLDRLDGLERMLDQHSILLTPHLYVPETDNRAVIDNEHNSLMYGIYNLGFLAVKNDRARTTIHRLVGGAAQAFLLRRKRKRPVHGSTLG